MIILAVQVSNFFFLEMNTRRMSWHLGCWLRLIVDITLDILTSLPQHPGMRKTTSQLPSVNASQQSLVTNEPLLHLVILMSFSVDQSTCDGRSWDFHVNWRSNSP
jgi:hypothetical protein